MYGRRTVYLLSVAMYFFFTIPSAVAKSAAVLIVFRFFAGLGVLSLSWELVRSPNLE